MNDDEWMDSKQKECMKENAPETFLFNIAGWNENQLFCHVIDIF